MKAVGYVRVSTEEQVREGVSIEAQIDKIREFARARGFELVEIFREEGVSGSVPLLKRPAFSKLLEFCKTNNVRYIIVTRLDRLARTSPFKLFEICSRLVLEYGVVVVPILEFDIIFKGDLIEEEAFFTTMAQFANLERELIRRRVRDTMQYLRKIGKITNIVEELEKKDRKKIDMIITLYKAGHSLRDIAKAFNLSTYAVRRILAERGVLQLPEYICPRCFRKMELVEPYPKKVYYCRNCGFERKIELV